MPRRAVRELQQLLAEGGEPRQPRQPASRPQHTPQLHRRRGGSGGSTTEGGCVDNVLLVCHRLQRSRYALCLALLFVVLVILASRELLGDGNTMEERGAAVKVSRNDPAAAVLEKALRMQKYKQDPTLEKAIQMKEYAEKTSEMKTRKKDELSIQQSALGDLRDLPDFPKIVHLVWPDKDVLSKDFEMLHHGAARLKELNPDWRFIVHDYEDVDATVRNFHHPDIPPSCTKQLANAHIVEKTDAFRLMVVYAVGGLYTDIDRVMNADLNKAIDVRTVKMASPTHYDINFSCDLFGSSPGNPLVLRALQRQCEERAGFPRKKGWIKPSDQMKLVRSFTASMEEGFFRRKIGSDSPLWDEARHVLSTQSEGMIMTRKDVWCSGLLVSDYEGCKEVSRDSLYDAYGVGEWADKVNEVWKDEGR